MKMKQKQQIQLNRGRLHMHQQRAQQQKPQKQVKKKKRNNKVRKRRIKVNYNAAWLLNKCCKRHLNNKDKSEHALDCFVHVWNYFAKYGSNNNSGGNSTNDLTLIEDYEVKNDGDDGDDRIMDTSLLGVDCARYYVAVTTDSNSNVRGNPSGTSTPVLRSNSSRLNSPIKMPRLLDADDTMDVPLFYCIVDVNMNENEIVSSINGIDYYKTMRLRAILLKIIYFKIVDLVIITMKVQKCYYQ